MNAAYADRPDGLRHSKETFDYKTTQTTVHLWDGQNICAEVGGDGNISAKYLRGINLIARKTSMLGLEYYLFNVHGDVVQLGNISYDYDAFGNQRETDRSDTNPFRFCGEYWDSDTQTLYLRNRHYAPSVGRFGAEDPIRDGLNWYTYCGGNPIRFVDPLGLALTAADRMKLEKSATATVKSVAAAKASNPSNTTSEVKRIQAIASNTSIGAATGGVHNSNLGSSYPSYINQTGIGASTTALNPNVGNSMTGKGSTKAKDVLVNIPPVNIHTATSPSLPGNTPTHNPNGIMDTSAYHRANMPTSSNNNQPYKPYPDYIYDTGIGAGQRPQPELDPQTKTMMEGFAAWVPGNISKAKIEIMFGLIKSYLDLIDVYAN